MVTAELHAEGLAGRDDPIEYVGCELGRNINLPPQFADVGDAGWAHHGVANFDLT